MITTIEVYESPGPFKDTWLVVVTHEEDGKTIMNAGDRTLHGGFEKALEYAGVLYDRWLGKLNHLEDEVKLTWLGKVNNLEDEVKLTVKGPK